MYSKLKLSNSYNLKSRITDHNKDQQIKVKIKTKFIDVKKIRKILQLCIISLKIQSFLLYSMKKTGDFCK